MRIHLPPSRSAGNRITPRAQDSRAALGTTNKLYYGDNLCVLRASIASESVELIYLAPLLKAQSGAQSQAQIEAFDDTWQRALAICETTLGREHPATAQTLAGLLQAEGDLAGAPPLDLDHPDEPPNL